MYKLKRKINIDVKQDLTVVTPVREIDSLTRVEIEELIRLYEGISIILVVDKMSNLDIPNVVEVLSPSNNLSYKRNLGVNLLETKYTAFLDSDAYPHKGWAEIGMKFLEENKNVGIVGGPNLEYKKLNQSQVIPIAVYRSRLVNNESSLMKEYKSVDYVASSNMIFRTSEYKDNGGMNEKVYTGEDIVLCAKYLDAGYKIIFLRDMKVSHKQRYLIGFLKQRFVWGRGVLNVFKYTKPRYIVSLAPLFGIIINIMLLIIDIYLETLWLPTALLIYSIIVTWESSRVTKNFKEFFKVFPYLFLSLYALGLGSLYGIFMGDIDNDYSMYDNRI